MAGEDWGGWRGDLGTAVPSSPRPFRTWLRVFSTPPSRRLQDWSRLALSNDLSCFLQGFFLVKGKWPQASSWESVESR